MLDLKSEKALLEGFLYALRKQGVDKILLSASAHQIAFRPVLLQLRLDRRTKLHNILVGSAIFIGKCKELDAELQNFQKMSIMTPPHRDGVSWFNVGIETADDRLHARFGKAERLYLESLATLWSQGGRSISPERDEASSRY